MYLWFKVFIVYVRYSSHPMESKPTPVARHYRTTPPKIGLIISLVNKCSTLSTRIGELWQCWEFWNGSKISVPGRQECDTVAYWLSPLPSSRVRPGAPPHRYSEVHVYNTGGGSASEGSRRSWVLDDLSYTPRATVDHHSEDKTFCSRDIIFICSKNFNVYFLLSWFLEPCELIVFRFRVKYCGWFLVG